MTPEQQQLAIILLKAQIDLLDALGHANLYVYQQTMELLNEVEESKIEAERLEAFDRSFNAKIQNALKQA